MMIDMATDRARLATALADFWYGGAGPSHGQVDGAFAIAGVAPDEGTKRERVSQAVREVPEPELFTLVRELIYLLRLRDLPVADGATLDRLRSALKVHGFNLDEAFELTAETHPGLDRLPDVPELREHAERLQRAVRDGDDAQLLGTTKELLETTAKVVLERTGRVAPKKFPALLTAAFEELQLHPKSAPASSEIEEPVRKILGGALQITMGIDGLRNTHGTGHGRSASVKLGRRQARLAAGAGVTIATLLIDTLEDPDAPWRRADAGARPLLQQRGREHVRRELDAVGRRPRAVEQPTPEKKRHVHCLWRPGRQPPSHDPD